MESMERMGVRRMNNNQEAFFELVRAGDGGASASSSYEG